MHFGARHEPLDRTVIRGLLVFGHWSWCAILAQPGDVLGHYTGYIAFEHSGGEAVWLPRSLVVAFFATCSLISHQGHAWAFFRDVIAGVQALWLFALAVMFATVWPWQTGVAVYSLLGFFAVWLIVARRVERLWDGR